RLDMKFWLFNGEHERSPSVGASFTKLHQKEEALERNQTGALARCRERWTGTLHKVRDNALQDAIAIGSGHTKLELWSGRDELTEFIVRRCHDIRKSRLIL